MSDLAPIKKRIESANGPDRALDAAIACAFIFKNHRPAQPTDFDGKFGYSPGNIKCEHGFLMADSYTRSLDAALALAERMLPGWEYEIYGGGKITPVVVLQGPTRHHLQQAKAATPVLALLSALLTALSAKAPDNTEDGR